MSHIITTDEEIKRISDYLEILRIKGYSQNTIYEILNEIIPINNEYQVSPEINSTGYTAFFSGYEKKIHINYEGTKQYVKKTIDWIIEEYPKLESQKEELFAYMTLCVLCHEVEHVYQHLISEGYIPHPYNIVKQAYKNLTNYKYKNNMPSIWKSILIERYIKQKDRATFVLERNANVEVYEMLSKTAIYENNPDMHLFVNNQYLWYLACGYIKIKNNGSFEESYRNIWRHGQYKTFDFTEDIPFEDRIRYGLPLEHGQRIELLQRFLDTKDNH